MEMGYKEADNWWGE